MVERVILTVVVVAMIVAAVWYLLVRRSAAKAKRTVAPSVQEPLAEPTGAGAQVAEPEAPDTVAVAPSGAAPTPADQVELAEPEPTPDAEPVPVLLPEAVRLEGAARDKEAAIAEVGELLVATGAVAPDYVPAMLARERSVSTFMGNLLAIPHGTSESQSLIHRSAIALVRYPGGIDWNGNRAEFVIGIAGREDDHVHMLSDIAGVFLDRAAIARLQAATEVADVIGVFAGADEAD